MKIRQFFINFLRRRRRRPAWLVPGSVGVMRQCLNILVDVKHLNVNFATLCIVNSGHFQRLPTLCAFVNGKFDMSLINF